MDANQTEMVGARRGALDHQGRFEQRKRVAVLAQHGNKIRWPTDAQGNML
uniref:Uncharacterized protein n=1 Tax=uncultured bacterium A1Q1_fos_25 TaxID=1256569 RepID=L7VWJ7_9BACT|nr:hypothetical protein [uncultured bacterium A1Q1_fos_25]